MNYVKNIEDAFIFSGNRSESVPRALFFDKRLTPLERNAWQIIRMMLESDGITALPTYEQLRPYLTSMPDAKKASSETVARALTVLRLTRWLSLVRKRRAKDGTRLSNLYILHDQPLLPFEAIRLDEDYLRLVCHAINHSSKVIQQVAVSILDDIANDPYLIGKKLPTRLEVLLGRITGTEPILSIKRESEVGQELDNSESEFNEKNNNNQSTINPKFDVSSSNKNIKILLQETQKHVDIPERFFALKENQQSGILQTIQSLTYPVQQQIFMEWDKRCNSLIIRKPAAYLFGIIQKAMRGELNALDEFVTKETHAINKAQKKSTSLPECLAKKEPIKIDQVKNQENINKLKQLFKQVQA